MKLVFSFCLFLFIMMPSATAEGYDIFGLINSTWSGDWEDLNYEAVQLDKVIHSTADMSGWIDIAGYRNMTRIDGMDYVYGGPVSCAIVEYDVWDLISGVKERWNDNVDWIHEDLEVRQDGDELSASLDVEMKWHHSVLKFNNGIPYIKKTYYYDNMTLTDTEKVPLSFNFTAENIAANVTVYNNTFAPKTLIQLPCMPGVMQVNYSYDNHTITHTRMIGRVERTDKNVEFVNMSLVDMWSRPSGPLSHIGDIVVIRGSNFSTDRLDVLVSTPYQTVEVADFNETTINYSAAQSVHPALYYIMSLFIVLISAIYFNIKSIWR
jgi:hypothetical protein